MMQTPIGAAQIRSIQSLYGCHGCVRAPQRCHKPRYHIFFSSILNTTSHAPSTNNSSSNSTTANMRQTALASTTPLHPVYGVQNNHLEPASILKK